MEDLPQRIRALNAELRKAGVRCSVGLKGDRLYLQRTLPPKPGSDRDRPYQQKVYTGLKGVAGLKIVRHRAELLAAAVATNTFRWEEWGWEPKQVQSRRKTVGDWIELYEEDWRTKGNRKEVTWKKDYAEVFNKLPQGAALTQELLIKRIKETEPRTKTRDRTCLALQRLAQFAGIDANFRDYMGYKFSQIQPRSLPEDKFIAQWRDSIRNEPWQYMFGLLATYGLRPHEVFHLKLEEFPILEVEESTKTGWRYVTPLYPEWAEKWRLDRYQLPKVSLAGDNRTQGGKVTGYFRRLDFRAPNFPDKRVTAYTLRHCYARRAFEFDYLVDDAARMMGHSPDVHRRTYRAWIDKQDYLSRYDRLLQRSDRPKPPT